MNFKGRKNLLFSQVTKLQQRYGLALAAPEELFAALVDGTCTRIFLGALGPVLVSGPPLCEILLWCLGVLAVAVPDVFTVAWLLEEEAKITAATRAMMIRFIGFKYLS